MPNWTKEQQLAIDKEGTNIIVSAGAGSGKTAVLSERVLRKVKEKVSVDKLLILTFTNAAAAEMKDRIRRKISTYSELQDELDKIDSAYITTFDSYSLSIVKKYHYLLNLSSNIQIGESSLFAILKEKYLEEIFEQKYQASDPVFLKLIDDFCTKDDSSIKEAIVKMDNSLSLLYNKKDYLHNYLTNYYSNLHLQKIITEYLNLINKYLDNIKNLTNELLRGVTPKYEETYMSIISPLLNSNDYESIKNSCQIKLPVLPRGMDEETKSYKTKISENLKKIQELTIYENEEEIKSTIVLTKDYVTALIDIILSLDEKMIKYKENNSIYEFTDIAKYAIRILDENENIREEIKASFSEILIDEYQDTSDLQDLFISKIENNNVYMVGDIKQSIYRFRNANPMLFKSKYNAYQNGNGGFKIDLNKNFRSRSEVLNNINLLFDYIMDSEIGGAEYRLNHRMEFGNTAYLKEDTHTSHDFEIMTYEIPKNYKFNSTEIEIFAIAKDIKEKINNKYQVFDPNTSSLRLANYSDFCILIDRSKSFVTYKKVFEYLNIPITIYRDESITTSNNIAIIKNIFNFLVHLANHNYDASFTYSFLSISRSYLINYDDDYIFDIITNKKYYETSLYKLGEELIKDYDEITPSQLFNNIIIKFDVYNKLISIGDINKHIIVYDYVMDLCKNLENIGYSIEKISQYLNDISEKKLDLKFSTNKETSNSCKIMTIHGSKGLEFPICYFSSLQEKYNIDEITDRISFNKDYGFILPFNKDGLHSTILKQLNSYKFYQNEISERIRLFYVALTRAREKMILITQLKDKSVTPTHGIIPATDRLSYRSTADILSSLNKIIAPYEKKIDIEKLNLTKSYNLTKVSNYQDNIPQCDIEIKTTPINIVNEELKSIKFSKDIHNINSNDTYQNIKFGLLCHQEFEQIDFNQPNYENINPLIANKIKKFIDTHILNNALNIYKEYEFIYTEDNEEYHGIIDLLLEFNDHYKIVDYKLKNINDDAYIKQLTGYKRYIESITNKKVELYLYSILEEKLINLSC